MVDPICGLGAAPSLNGLLAYTLRDLRIVRKTLETNPQPQGFQRRKELGDAGVSLYHLALPWKEASSVFW